ncbi:MAG: hemolysin family protein [Thermodesulfobacteriota bacterium]
MEDAPRHGLRRRVKAFFRRLTENHSAESLEEEIKDLIDHGAEQGKITPGEGEMIHSIFELGETLAREIMVPRISMATVPVDASLGQVIDAIIKKGHTRLPVYKGDIDHIEGLLLAKDLLAYWGLSAEEPLPRNIIRPPIFVPETKKIVDLLAELKAKKSHMAIILDEYGGTAGLVTLEDIIEEIVGDIHDEYDTVQEPIKRLDQNTILVDARLGIWDLADYLAVDFPEGDYETVGGFITDLTGRVPAENETLQYQNLLLTIKSADERKIDLIEIKSQPAAGSPSDDA